MNDCKVKRFAQSIYHSAFCRCENTSKAEQTRERIILAAFEEMYENGYQGMRIENILKKTDLAKGALYHHFPSKKILGYAVVDEVLFATMKTRLSALDESSDPMATFCEILLQGCSESSDDDVSRGCPLNNLTQEMTGLDDGFHERLLAIFTYWQEAIVKALEKGKTLGQIKSTTNASVVATFIISSIQGCTGTAKCMQSQEIFQQLLETLCQYIQSLRVDV